ncbi:hypothetical protein Bca52824_001705 [Brassica carinata]|uniref:Disease resistance protein n=1 Tax=Brassica carinata TaxID=52824 RepID=A0A8X7WKP4_BRACI|nr:hypothetical protein Bca52824_001705 [Brassica carinata]
MISSAIFALPFPGQESLFKKTLMKWIQFQNVGDEANRWQAALKEITQIPGYILTDKSESEFIDEIVRDALEVLRSNDKKNMIGMDMHIKEILSLLCIESPDVCSIGIFERSCCVLYDNEKKMCNLRLLKLYFSEVIENHGVYLPQGLEYLPSKLRLLHWEHYPISTLPQCFDPKNLSLENLKKMRLSYSYQLTKIPRLSSAPNLELLDLEGCKSLVSISQSICYLRKLVSLNLKDCSNLESVPSTVELESLEVLNLSGCSKLENFPEISPNVKELYLG